MTGELLASLSPMERLRWRVLDYFRLPPTAELAPENVLWCAANMVLDIKSGRGEREKAQNPAFDEERFDALREG